MNKYIGHFKTICRHKWITFLLCKDCGITWQGIIHDMSKFNPTEFFESAKYYTTGKESPIIETRKAKGISEAWLHHKGRNKHHWEYWLDNCSGNENRMNPLKMDYKYVVEFICDQVSASKTYLGSGWNLESNYKYLMKHEKKVVMHPETWMFIKKAYDILRNNDWNHLAHILKNHEITY